MGCLAGTLDMKPLRIILYALLIALAAYLWLSARACPVPVRQKAGVVSHPLEVADPVVIPEILGTATEFEQPVALAEPVRPVQPLEERGDAMLFEASALEGTPFDQAVVRPFE